MDLNRFDRQIKFFGKEGQDKIKATSVTIAGVGGLGSHAAQQLAFLGVGKITVIDNDILEESNLNRLIGVNSEDIIGETRKTEISNRLIKSINPEIEVIEISKDFLSEESYEATKDSSHVFGCFDNDGARLKLNELSLAYKIPYLDLASDIIGEEYGGRVFINLGDYGCLYCYGLLSAEDAGIDLSSTDLKKDREEIYGIPKEKLDMVGPSVVSINGVVASLAVSEFMVMVTGIRDPERLLTYRGSWGSVSSSDDKPREGCYYCNTVRGIFDKLDVNRFLKSTKLD